MAATPRGAPPSSTSDPLSRRRHAGRPSLADRPRTGYPGSVAQGVPRSRLFGRVPAALLALLAAALAAVAAHGALGAQARADRADLIVRALSTSPPEVRAGGRVRATTTVVNDGRRGSRKARLGYYLSGDRKLGPGDVALRPTQGLRRMSPGGWSQRSTLLRIPAAMPDGRFRLLACADVSKRVRERNERNNCRAARTRLTVAGPAGGPSPSGPLQPDGSPAPGGSPQQGGSPGPGGSPTDPPTDPDPTPDTTAPSPTIATPAEGARTNDNTPLL